MNKSHEQTEIKDLLFQYVGLKAQVRALQHEMRSIYPSILEAMEGSDEKLEVGGAIVSYRARKKYKYSDTIVRLTDELKVRKKHEIETGVAEVESETGSVFVRFKKTEE